MSIYASLIPIISKVSPVLGSALGGPAGGLVGSLISATLGVDMNKPEELLNKITNDPSYIDKLKELELQLKDLQDARSEASKETGALRFVRPMLIIFSFVVLLIDMFLLYYLDDETIKQILLVFTGILVYDIRQIYKFYFGIGDDTSLIPKLFKKIK